jgi:hypothetical protein
MGQDVLSFSWPGLAPKGGPRSCHPVFYSRDGEVWNFKFVVRICQINSAVHVRPNDTALQVCFGTLAIRDKGLGGSEPRARD